MIAAFVYLFLFVAVGAVAFFAGRHSEAYKVTCMKISFDRCAERTRWLEREIEILANQRNILEKHFEKTRAARDTIPDVDAVLTNDVPTEPKIATVRAPLSLPKPPRPSPKKTLADLGWVKK